MKKSTIWFLTIIMALTFTGLLYVQIMYMRNMVKMRDDQFAEGVKRSLYAVTTRLEQDETKHYLEEDVASIETQYLPRYDADGHVLGTVTSSFSTPEVSGDITIKRDLRGGASQYQSNQELLRGLYLYQKGLLNEVVLNIISQASNRPIAERADSAVVEGYMRSEFANNGLDLPFEFAVVNRMGAPVYRTSGYAPADAGRNSMFVQTLFPNDPKNKMNYIKVYFPTKDNYIFSSIRFMIPSFIFTFILLVVFIYTIVVAFRQKKLTEMKNDFINNMTHEFKTPISTISLAAQMLNDGSVVKSEKMLSHISGVINDETKRLRFQVEKVLQMSMFDRQKATLRLTDVDANTAVANIVHTFKLKVEKYGGSIESHLDAMDSMVNVDEMHFTNVIFNLLDNAVKYRREDTPLKLVVTTRDVSNHKIRITVADNGIGIRRDDLKKIFEKFYRVSTGNRHDVKGFGLGLAYVHKMVGELGGEITVESEINQGTKFNIILPLTKNLN
ncbi:MAG: HAMP domain-containing histidine kinase [Bacteroides sp.]|nr:HAMP domain-containing histidine kinase [Bacteroidales bacterium]MBD5316257.1 HAMP domain-containing histidine kinase [Bacteroides sp.]MBD5377777.1 HAMP domain-containing histidine kinase [Bacteroides sp.]